VEKFLDGLLEEERQGFAADLLQAIREL